MKTFYLFLLFSLCAIGVYAQNDCVDAIIICGNANYQGLSATGVGIQELSNNHTCNSMEHNSLWLEIPIKTGGTLGFTLIPENTSINVDFDFFIFGPTATCGNLGQAIRCSTTNPAASGAANNHTGMNATATDISEGPGQLGNNFVQWLTVQSGETYFLVIDRPIGSSNFSIEWTGTAEFHEIPTIDPTITLDQEKCDGDSVDDQSTFFNLKENTAPLMTNNPNVTLTFHENLNDVVVGENPIVNPATYTNTSNPQTIFIRLTNTVTGCYSTSEFSIKVTDDMVIAGSPENLSLCDTNGTGFRKFDLSKNDEAVQNDIALSSVTYYTSLEDAQNKTNPLDKTYQNKEAYLEQKIWVRLDGTGLCLGNDIKSFTINVTPIPDANYSLEIVDFNYPENAISIKIDSPENYEFSIDGKHFSNNPRFEQLTNGIYTIYIRDKIGCLFLSEEVVLLDYPKFFTPNGDGQNEVWNIPYIHSIPKSTIQIYDRFGKLLSTSKRWDGTYNGKRMPSSEYWFVLKLEENKQVKGHFSLIR